MVFSLIFIQNLYGKNVLECVQIMFVHCIAQKASLKPLLCFSLRKYMLAHSWNYNMKRHFSAFLLAKLFQLYAGDQKSVLSR